MFMYYFKVKITVKRKKKAMQNSFEGIYPIL